MQMARKKLSEVAPRTVRVHIPTYNSILEFFALSPSGIRGSDAIRQLLYRFGLYCEEQLQTGRVASSRDLTVAEDLIYDTLRQSGNAPDKPTSTPPEEQ
jgi:hypothetical protein